MRCCYTRRRMVGNIFTTEGGEFGNENNNDAFELTFWQQRVVNGDEATLGSHPWAGAWWKYLQIFRNLFWCFLKINSQPSPVSLEQESGAYFCGGSIISNKYTLPTHYCKFQIWCWYWWCLPYLALITYQQVHCNSSPLRYKRSTGVGAHWGPR